MFKNKSINSNFSIWYLLGFCLLTILFFLHIFPHFFAFFVIAYSLLPIVFFTFRSKYKTVYSIVFSLFSIEFLLFLLTFRKLRQYFPPPEIGKNIIVGYTQYFGYPFYFDTLLFFFLVLSPIVFLLILKYTMRFQTSLKGQTTLGVASSSGRKTDDLVKPGLFFYIYLLMLLIFIFFSFRSVITNPFTAYNNLSFDKQNVFTWEYTVIKGYLPYKDIFFPYGLIFYHRHTIIFFRILFIFLPLFYVSTIAYILKKAWVDNQYVLLSVTAFSIFITRFSGIETIYRYGTLVTFVFFLSYQFYKNKHLSKKIIVCVGIIIGLLFGFINDQGTYAFIIFCVFLLFQPVLLKNPSLYFSKKYVLSLIKNVFYLIIGLAIGILPFFMYLLLSHSFISFIHFLSYISDLAVLAKTPFTPSIKTPENIFIFGVLILCIIYVGTQLIFSKKESSFTLYAQSGLLFILLLLEQKNIIRSIEKSLTFIAFLLLLLLLKNVIQTFKIHKQKAFLYTLFVCITFLYVFPMQPILPIKTSPVDNGPIKKKTNALLKSHSEYEQVIQYVQRDVSFNNRVFSYPADPIFYVKLNQKPPFYFTGYEATPDYAQREIITYMKNQNIQYVVYNMNYPILQDQVPNYIRNTEEMKHIVTQFIPEKMIGNFLIFKKRTGSEDFFEQPNPLKNYLLFVNFEHIPYNEGLYKKNYLSKTRLSFSNVKDANDYVKNHSVYSQKTLLLFQYNNTQTYATVVLTAENGLQSQIKFFSCQKGNYCIIDLDTVPLFYKSRRVIKIDTDSTVRSIQFVKNSKENIFW